MELESRLRSFAAVARAGSFSQAAEALYVSQPAVSKQVAALEAELGRQLLVRGSRGVTLTPAGQVLADYVLRAEALLANARRALGAGDDDQIGTLSLAASGVPGTYLLPSLLASFRARHPGVELDFTVTTSEGALERVRAHDVELAIVGGLTVPTELETEPLVEDDIVLVGPPHLGGRRLRAKDVETLTWVLREEGSATRAAVDAARWELGLRQVPTLELPSWEAVKLAVAHGAGIAPISSFALEVERKSGTLVVLDFPRWRLRRTISLVTARDVPLTLPAERFRTMLRERFRSDEEQLPPNSNLPTEPTPLVGRERELDDVVELLRGSRLVTLTGAGGSGKTRLALAAAARLVDAFRDGVYLVELAAISRPELVERAIADVVGDDLTNRRLLLVLDNFEHVMGAGRAVSRLLARTEHLRVLVTSRTRLRLRSETEYRVLPLEPHDAAQLFVERALAADARFEADAAVEAICERVDRLPLAIEIAAGRVTAFPPRELLERLEHRLPVLVGGARDLPARQRTLRRTVEWSYDLLTPDSADAFERLAAFRGGWAPDGAEALDVGAEALEELVDANLVQRADARFTMLETIRELGRERLLERPDVGGLRGAHASWALMLAREAHAYARGPEMQPWFHRLAVEHDNMREALTWAVESGDVGLGLELAGALEAFWTRRRHLDALAYLEPLLALDGGDPAARARVLGLAGVLGDEADHPLAEQWMRDGLELAHSLGDDEAAAWALKALGRRALHRGELDEAEARFEESRALFERLELWVPVGGRLNDLSKVARARGDVARAVELVHSATEADARGGDPQSLPSNLHELGDLALLAGDDQEARRSFAEALRLARDLGEERIEVHALGGLAAFFARGGRPDVAGRIWSAVDEAPLDSDSRRLYASALAAVAPHRPALALADATELALLESGE